ncbi:MAG: hypothetical protein P4L39_02100 [Humidesulfovibrio sp.]|nr:hypothetical protein [Humidesulfovibrio sp.]
MKRLLALAACAALLCGCAGRPLPLGGADLTDPSRQLLLVVAEDWQYTEARMQRFERSGPDGDWKPVGTSFAVNLGRNGLGWGRGLHGLALGAGPVKREGDGRAPAGLFALGQGFARDPGEVGPATLPLVRVDEGLVCVDDSHSRLYNQLVESAAVGERDWNSAEVMSRPDGQYRLGVFVRHNAESVQPGDGSCIFLHIWLGRGVASSGCTNMDQADMLLLLRWLDASKHPVLAQLPRRDFERLRIAWRLEQARP